MSRLGLKRRLLLAVIAAVAVTLIGLVAAFNLILGWTLDNDARDVARSRALTQLAALRTDKGRLVLAEAPDERAADAAVWVFAGRRALEQPSASAPVDAAARSLTSGPARFVDVSSNDTRLYAAPAVAHGRRVGTVVAAVSLAPYEHTRRLAFLASLVLGALILLLVAAASRWLLVSALRPVVRMTRQAADWSERDLDRRFGSGRPDDELSELATTLDGLLDRLAASLRREQRFSAELSHELRTPLARVLAESELALRRERETDEYRRVLELVHRNARQLSRIIDTLVAAARYEAGQREVADARAVAAGAVAACSALANERQIQLDVASCSRPLRLGLGADLAERILQPVLENACRYGSSRVRVSIERDSSSVVYAIEDDGPGVPEDERERIFEPGVRGRARRADGESGAGLGLALARRLARGVSGDVAAAASTTGGRFLVRLPAG
jgi:two-component system OmpR family sensor kinase